MSLIASTKRARVASRAMADNERNPQDATEGVPTPGKTNCAAAGIKRPYSSSRPCSAESRRFARRRVSTPTPQSCRAAKVPKVQDVAPEAQLSTLCKDAAPEVQLSTLRKDVTPEHFLSTLRTIVINLDSRPDRMQGCETRFKSVAPMIKFERFRATDGRRDAISTDDVVKAWHTGRNVIYQRLRSLRKGWNDLDSYKVRDLQLSPGERGCADSHIRAWKMCVEQAGSSERPFLVMEDDAAPTAEFVEVLTRALATLPQDAHVLYLGYSQAADWKRTVSPNLVESRYVWTTVAYMVWPAGARKLLKSLPVDQPVDNWMAQACADGDLNAYCVTPKVVRQAEAWNTGSDVAHSDEQYWGPDSDIRHSDEFYWGAEPGVSAEAAPSQNSTSATSAPVPLTAATIESDSMPMGAMAFDFGSSDYWDIGSLE